MDDGMGERESVWALGWNQVAEHRPVDKGDVCECHPMEVDCCEGGRPNGPVALNSVGGVDDNGYVWHLDWGCNPLTTDRIRSGHPVIWIGSEIGPAWHGGHPIAEPDKAADQVEHPHDPREGPDVRDRSVLREALDVVYGRGEKEYDHPSRNFGRIADAWNSLHPDGGVAMTPEGVAIFMILKKLSRQIHCPKRDNWVDIAGYAEAASRLGERDG